MGFTMQSSTLAVQAACKPKYMATVTTLVQFVRTLGQVFGVAIVGSVFNNKLTDDLEKSFPGDPNVLLVGQVSKMEYLSERRGMEATVDH